MARMFSSENGAAVEAGKVPHSLVYDVSLNGVYIGTIFPVYRNTDGSRSEKRRGWEVSWNAYDVFATIRDAALWLAARHESPSCDDCGDPVYGDDDDVRSDDGAWCGSCMRKAMAHAKAVCEDFGSLTWADPNAEDTASAVSVAAKDGEYAIVRYDTAIGMDGCDDTHAGRALARLIVREAGTIDLSLARAGVPVVIVNSPLPAIPAWTEANCVHCGGSCERDARAMLMPGGGSWYCGPCGDLIVSVARVRDFYARPAGSDPLGIGFGYQVPPFNHCRNGYVVDETGRTLAVVLPHGVTAMVDDVWAAHHLNGLHRRDDGRYYAITVAAPLALPERTTAKNRSYTVHGPCFICGLNRAAKFDHYASQFDGSRWVNVCRYLCFVCERLTDAYNKQWASDPSMLFCESDGPIPLPSGAVADVYVCGGCGQARSVHDGGLPARNGVVICPACSGEQAIEHDAWAAFHERQYDAESDQEPLAVPDDCWDWYAADEMWNDVRGAEVAQREAWLN